MQIVRLHTYTVGEFRFARPVGGETIPTRATALHPFVFVVGSHGARSTLVGGGISVIAFLCAVSWKQIITLLNFIDHTFYSSDTYLMLLN